MKKRKSGRIVKAKRATTQRNVKKTTLSISEIPAQFAKSIKITYSTAVVSKKGKKIHARKRLPKLPVKKQVPDKNPSPPTII